MDVKHIQLQNIEVLTHLMICEAKCHQTAESHAVARQLVAPAILYVLADCISPAIEYRWYVIVWKHVFAPEFSSL